VTVVTGFSWYNLDEMPKNYQGNRYMCEKMERVNIIRIRLNVPGPKKMQLIVGYFLSPLSMLAGGMLASKADVCYGYSSPLPVGLTGWLLGKIKKHPFVLGAQDLHLQAYC